MLRPKTYQFLVGVFASLGSVLYGYDLGVIGGCVAAPSFVSTFTPSSNEIGAVVSVFTGGAFFGAGVAGPVGDWLGRRFTIMIGAIVFCLGGALQTGAQSLGYLYAGRAIAGLGVGVLTMIIPLYQAELAHPDIRGRITSLQQLMLALGALVAGWCTYGTNLNLNPTDDSQWRVPLGIQIVPAIFLAVLIFVFPESPRWLIDHGRSEEGLRTLARLHANGNERDLWVLAEYEQIQNAINDEHQVTAGGYRELFRDRSSFRRLLLCVALQASVQMTGVSAIQYFSPTIYGTLNVSTSDTLKYQAISNVLALIAICVTSLTVDRTGRRWPLISGNLVNCLCFIIVTAVVALFPTVRSSSTQNSLFWLFVVTLWTFNVSFSYTCGTLSWVIPSEVFDTKTRSKGVSIATMTAFAFNTMIGQVTDPAIGAVNWRYFLVFVVCNLTNAVFFWALLPETAKRPLEEMNSLFSSRSWFVPAMHSEPVQYDLGHRVEEKIANPVLNTVEPKNASAHVESRSAIH